MKFVDELTATMNEINATFANHFSLVDKYLEFAQAELAQNIESAELRYLSESDSDSALDTLNYLYQEAGEGFSAKAATAIDKLSSIFDEFIKDVRSRVQKFLLDSTIEGKLKTLERKISFNPFLKNKKIEYVVDERGVEMFEALYHTIIKGLAKAKSGKDCGAETEKIQSRMTDWSDYKNEVKYYAVADKVLSTFKETVRTVLTKIDFVEASGHKILKECKAVSKEQGGSDALGLGRAAVRASKITVNAGINQINSILSGLSVLAKTTTKEIADKDVEKDAKNRGDIRHDGRRNVRLPMSESTVDTFAQELFGDLIMEATTPVWKPSTNTDFTEMYTSMMESSLKNEKTADRTKPEDDGLAEFARKMGFL